MMKSKLVLKCLQNLIFLCENNNVTLCCVPRNKAIRENEAADSLTEQRLPAVLSLPKPILGVTKFATRHILINVGTLGFGKAL